MDLASLPEIVDGFFALLEERAVPYLLVGGIALLQYVAGRNTEDIDIILSAPDLARLPEIEIEDRRGFFVRGSYRGLRIDLLLSENPLFQIVARDHATRRPMLNREIPCATAEGLLLLKLYALPSLYRQYDFSRVNIYESDIASLLHSSGLGTGRLLDLLRPHLIETDLKSLEPILAEIQVKLGRFKQGNGGSPGS